MVFETKATPGAVLLGAGALLLALASGCAPEEDATFGVGGNPYDVEDDSDDTGEGGDDTGEVENPDAPVITAFTAEIADYGQTGLVLLLTISFSDANDDVDGGKVNVSVLVEGQEDPIESSLDIGGEFAWIDNEGDITIAFDDIDTTATYEVTVSVQDAAGNVSAEATDSTDS